MNINAYEKIYLKSKKLDIDWMNLSETDYFIHFMYARILELSSGESAGKGDFSKKLQKESQKKALVLKKSIISPLLRRRLPANKKFLNMLRDAGHPI